MSLIEEQNLKENNQDQQIKTSELNELNEDNKLLGNSYSIDINNLNKFKNDLIEYIKKIEKNLKNSLSSTTEKIYDISSNLDEKFLSIDEKTKLLTDLISETKFDISKFNEFEKFKKLTEDKIISFDIRIQNNQKNISQTNLKYDQLFIKEFQCPNLLGKNQKYETVKDFIYWINSQTEELKSKTNKISNTITVLQTQRENSMSDISKLLESTVKQCNIYTEKRIKQIEKVNEEFLKKYNEKIMDVKMLNCKEAIELQNKTNELIEKIDDYNELKKNVFNKIDEGEEKYKLENEITLQRFDEIWEEFKEIKSKFGKLADFIKDIKFKKNLNEFVNPVNKQIKKQFVNKKIIRTLTHNLKLEKNFSIDSDDVEKVDVKYNPYKNDESFDENIKSFTKSMKNINNNSAKRLTFFDNNEKSNSKTRRKFVKLNTARYSKTLFKMNDINIDDDDTNKSKENYKKRYSYVHKDSILKKSINNNNNNNISHFNNNNNTNNSNNDNNNTNNNVINNNDKDNNNLNNDNNKNNNTNNNNDSINNNNNNNNDNDNNSNNNNNKNDNKNNNDNNNNNNNTNNNDNNNNNNSNNNNSNIIIYHTKETIDAEKSSKNNYDDNNINDNIHDDKNNNIQNDNNVENDIEKKNKINQFIEKKSKNNIEDFEKLKHENNNNNNNYNNNTNNNFNNSNKDINNNNNYNNINNNNIYNNNIINKNQIINTIYQKTLPSSKTKESRNPIILNDNILKTENNINSKNISNNIKDNFHLNIKLKNLNNIKNINEIKANNNNINFNNTIKLHNKKNIQESLDISNLGQKIILSNDFKYNQNYNSSNDLLHQVNKSLSPIVSVKQIVLNNDINKLNYSNKRMKSDFDGSLKKQNLFIVNSQNNKGWNPPINSNKNYFNANYMNSPSKKYKKNNNDDFILNGMKIMSLGKK